MSNDFNLSPLESEVLRVIKSVGLQEHLWFPIVKRELLDIRSDGSDEQIHAAVVALARKHVIIDVETRCLHPPKWVAVPHVPKVEAATAASQSPAVHNELGVSAGGLSLSLLEAQIIRAVDHVGWFAYLWFPKVQRELMNFGSDEAEERVHSALVGLSRRGLLVLTEVVDEYPQWNPTAAGLEAAAKLEFRSQIP